MLLILFTVLTSLVSYLFMEPILRFAGASAAILAQNNIKSIECVEYPELGMEAIWKIEVEDFPAFILVDDKGNDFFKQLKPWNCSK